MPPVIASLNSRMMFSFDIEFSLYIGRDGPVGTMPGPHLQAVTKAGIRYNPQQPLRTAEGV